MFYLQENLEATGDVLDFYCTSYTTTKTEKTSGKIISWSKADTHHNSIIIPDSSNCKLEGVRVKESRSLDIHEIELHAPLAENNGKRIRIPLSFHPIEIEQEHKVLANIKTKNQTSSGIIQLGEDTILFAFDPGETIKAIITYDYLENKSSMGLSTWINRVGAIVATRLPLKITNYMIKKYLQLAKTISKDAGYPAWPLDNSVDVLRDVFLKTMAMVSDSGKVEYLPHWPENKKWCFCSTHDVDTTGGFQNISFVRKVERKHSMPSAWYITHEINPDTGFLQELEKDGCEVGSHGWVHDDRWRLLSDDELEDRFRKSMEQFKDLKVRGFRAPYNEFHPAMFPILRKYFTYDTSAQETRIYASVIAHRLGCCTQFPYKINGVIELPTTMPPDYLLINTLEHSPKEVYDIWGKKLLQIKENGSMAVLQTHPEEFDIGNERYITAYEELIAKVCEMEGECLITTPQEIVEWWKTRSMKNTASEDEVMVIRYEDNRFTTTKSASSAR